MVDLRPKGELSSLVQQWVSAVPRTAAQPTMPDFVPRAERLGLGAKFISHSQAAALGIDEQRFQRKLKKKAAAPGGEAGAHAAAVAASAGCAAVAASAGGADESDDDDEDSRASAFALRRGPDSAHTARPKAPAGIAKPAHNLKRRQEPAAKPKQGRRLA